MHCAISDSKRSEIIIDGENRHERHEQADKETRDQFLERVAARIAELNAFERELQKLNRSKQVFFCCNRERNTAEILTGFSCWEEVQGCFRVGFLMADGHSADGIGRCKSLVEFQRKATHGGTAILNKEAYALL